MRVSFLGNASELMPGTINSGTDYAYTYDNY